MKFQSSCQPGCSHLKAQLGEDLLPSSFVTIGRPQVLAGCWLEMSVLCHVGLSVRQLTTCSWPLLEQVRTRECPGQKIQTFCNLLSQVISLHFCQILIVKSKSLDPSTFEGGYTTSCSPKDQAKYRIGLIIFLTVFPINCKTLAI